MTGDVRRLHVVGAGIAGLVAALAGRRTGWEVALYEAARQAGGRCRAVIGTDGFVHDNGTHVLVGANRRALALLEAIGASDRWVEPEPDGLPVVDLVAGTARRVGLSPWSWRDPAKRPGAIGLADLLRMVALVMPGPDRPVGAVVGSGALARFLVEPLTVAALNTPIAEASTQRLARVLRRMAGPGTARVLVARRGLGPDLIDPAVSMLGALGVVPTLGRRLRGLAVRGGRAERLVFADGEEPLGPDDRVVLALPPHALAAILPDLPLPEAYEPIVNLHFAADYGGAMRFVGVLGGIAQWVLFREQAIAVTISAARQVVDRPAEELIRDVWGEVVQAASLAGVATLPATPPTARVVKERRATLRQAVGDDARPSRHPLANVALAGDWLSPLPATIEAAVASGETALSAFSRSTPLRINAAGWRRARG